MTDKMPEAPNEWMRRLDSATPYPGWEFLFTLDGVMHHRPTHETLNEMQRKADIADKLAETLTIARNSLEGFIIPTYPDLVYKIDAALKAYREAV